MKTPTTAALTALAIARADRSCAEALAFLAVGRKVFVKGKATVAPFSPEKRAQILDLQRSAFAPGMQVDAIVSAAVDVIAEGATDEASEERILAEAVAIYCAAGRAEVERAFAA